LLGLTLDQQTCHNFLRCALLYWVRELRGGQQVLELCHNSYRVRSGAACKDV